MDASYQSALFQAQQPSLPTRPSGIVDPAQAAHAAKEYESVFIAQFLGAMFYGIKIHQMEGLDLKDDIDGSAALCAALDLVLSAPTAAAATAASVGTMVWFLTAGRTWPQLWTNEYPWYASTRVLSPEKFGDWNALMPDVADELEVFASGAERKPLI